MTTSNIYNSVHIKGQGSTKSAYTRKKPNTSKQFFVEKKVSRIPSLRDIGKR